MANTGRTFGALIGINGTALQFLMVLQAISFIIFGPILGSCVDKKGALIVLRILSVICIIPGVLLALFMDITPVFMLAFVINVIGVSGILIGFGPFIMEIYGIQESVILGGIISAFSKISEITTTVTAFIVSLFFKDVEKLKVPYRAIYIISSIFCTISAILLLLESNEKVNYTLEIPMSNEDSVESQTESLQSID